MFQLKEKEYTLEQIEKAAKASNMDVDAYINKAKEESGLIDKRDKPGKTNLTSPGADVKDPAAPDTDSKSEDGSLEYTGSEPFKDFKEKKSVITEEGEAELRQLGDGEFQPIELEEVVVEGVDKTKIREAKERDARIKAISRISKIPELGVSVSAGVAATTLDITKGFLELIDKYGSVPVTNAIGKALGYDATLKEDLQLSADNYAAFDEVTNLFRNYTIKKFDEKGNEIDIVGLLKKGDYENAADLSISEGFSAAPYLALSIISPIYGSALIGASVTGQEIATALKERPEESLLKLYGASALKGGVEFATNAIGGGLQRGFLGIGKTLNIGTNAYKKAAKEFTKTYMGKFASSAAGLTKSGAVNFIEEFSAEIGNSLVDNFVYGDKQEFYAEIRKATNAGFAGLVLGAPIGGIGGFNSIASKNEALKFIAPAQWRKDYGKLRYRLSQVEVDLQNAPENKKQKFTKQKRKIESLMKMREQQLAESFNNLTKKEKKTYLENLKIIDDAFGEINNDRYTDAQQLEAKERLDRAAAENQILVGQEFANADEEIALRIIAREIRSSEIIKESLKKANAAGIKDLEIKFATSEDLNNPRLEGLKTSEGVYDSKTKTIYINQAIANEAEQTNVIGHELLHYIMAQKFAVDDASLEPLVNSFKEYLKKTQPRIYEKIQQRIDEYYSEINEAGEKVIKQGALEEYFNVFSDLVSKEKVIVNESFSDKIKNTTKRFLNSQGFGSVELNTGKEVFDFIRNYTKNIKNFNFKQLGVDLKSSEIPKKVQETVNEEQTKFSKSGASERVQEIYESQGAANALDIIDEFKPITNKIVNRYKDVPGFEFELLRDEIETGKRGILDMIMDYTPEKAKGAPLAAYINSLLPKRAIEAANRILDTEFKLDVTEAKSVTDTTTEEVTEIQEQETSEELKSLRKKMGIGDEIIPIVFGAVQKTFGTKLPDIDEKTFKKELEKRYRTELKKPISKLFGKGEAYESFLRDNFETIYNSLPQSIFNKRLKEFAEPVLDEDGKQKREKTAEGNKIFTKKKISKAEFIKYFLGSDVGRSTQGTRKTAIVEAVAEAFAFAPPCLAT